MARNRNVQIIFWVSENEKSMIEEKMAQAGMSNLSAYLRRIAIDGMIVRLELPELKEMVSLLRYASNNINQIARRMNEEVEIFVGPRPEQYTWILKLLKTRKPGEIQPYKRKDLYPIK